MKIVYSHLLNFLEEKPSINNISERLFQLGHENEVFGQIIDIEFTPNRGDCLSLLGLSRDLGVFYKLKKHLTFYEDDINILDINFKNHSPDSCPVISFLDIEIEEIPSKYQDYLEDYFRQLKVKKNNFFTDISNFINYEMGQPTHCYERASIKNSIDYIQTNSEIRFETLLNKSIKLSGTNSIFRSNNQLINLAGVMGGINTACSKNTKNALVECAYFTPESIIGKALKYNLHSDASYKFERGVDPCSQEKVLRRFIKIVSDHTKIKKIKLFNHTYKDLPIKKIPFNTKKIKNIIGIDLDSKAYKDFLNKLGFEVNNLEITVPSFRHDISNQNDLAEEVARIIGYDNIKPCEFKINKFKTNNNYEDDSSLRNFLISNGFFEVINMPFAPNSHDAIKIDNPLDSNKQFLRTSLENSLVQNLLYNEKRQKESIKLYEIADIYKLNHKGELESSKYLGVIVSGRVGNNYKEFSKKLDSKYLMKLFNSDSKNIFEITRENLNTKIKSKIFMYLVKLEDMPKRVFNTKNKAEQNFKTYVQISEFPSTTRDLSFSVKNLENFKELEDFILSYKHPLIKDSFVFDFFNNVTKNEIKIGFRFIFQSKDSTITDGEVNPIIKEIMNTSLGINTVKMPGYNNS